MFGVFIRSVEERTEKLCLESCQSCIPREHIHIIRNEFPAYKAFMKMFEQAEAKGYDWFLGLDADIVLVPGWYETVLEKKAEMEKEDWFVFTISVRDKFLGKIDRGNHFYNGKYVGDALEALQTKTKDTLKPESKIRHHMGAKNRYFDDISIGYHGYEQFFSDIFYRFWLQSKRLSKLERKHPFLRKKPQKMRGQDMDFFAAQKGWRTGKDGSAMQRWLRSRFPSFMKNGTVSDARSDASLRETLFSEHLKDMQEKAPLTLSWESFLESVQHNQL